MKLQIYEQILINYIKATSFYNDKQILNFPKILHILRNEKLFYF